MSLPSERPEPAVELYPIGRDGRPDLAILSRQAARGADVLFTIHHAGWPQPVSELRALCDEVGLRCWSRTARWPC